jgi:hypothetical protein
MVTKQAEKTDGRVPSDAPRIMLEGLMPGIHLFGAKLRRHERLFGEGHRTALVSTTRVLINKALLDICTSRANHISPTPSPETRSPASTPSSLASF